MNKKKDLKDAEDVMRKERGEMKVCITEGTMVGNVEMEKMKKRLCQF